MDLNRVPTNRKREGPLKFRRVCVRVLLELIISVFLFTPINHLVGASKKKIELHFIRLDRPFGTRTQAKCLDDPGVKTCRPTAKDKSDGRIWISPFFCFWSWLFI